MNGHYDVEEWAAGTIRGRQVFNYNYGLSGKEIRGWKLLEVVTMQAGPDASEKVYLWQSNSDPDHALIRVDITERADWRLAQQSLHQSLLHSMRPDIPRGTKRLAQLGDINFVGREPQTDVVAGLSFTRGNVYVSVRSAGEKSVDVSGIAAYLDGALSEPPAPRELEKEKAQAITPKVVAVKTDEAYVLIKSLQKATPSGGWLKIIVFDGELSRKGDALLYVSDQGGKKRVEGFAIGGRRAGGIS